LSRFRLVRLVRTGSSEVFVAWDENRRIAQVDLHFGDRTVHATVVLEAPLSSADQQELYAQIDEDVVSSYMPSFERDDLVFTVFKGQEVDSFSYPEQEEELPGEEEARDS